MISSFTRNFARVFEVFPKITTYKLWGYVWLSGMLSLLVASFIIFSIIAWNDEIGTWLISKYPFEWGADFLTNISSYLSGSLLAIIGLMGYKYIILLVSSPIMSFVSEKVEYEITGDRVEGFSIPRFIDEFLRGIRIAVTNFFKEIILLFILFLIGLVIPVVLPVVTVLSFLIQSYYAGFGAADYFMERRYSVPKSFKVIEQIRWGVIGIGSAFMVIIFVPVVGWIFGPILSTIAATEYAIEEGLE